MHMLRRRHVQHMLSHMNMQDMLDNMLMLRRMTSRANILLNISILHML